MELKEFVPYQRWIQKLSTLQEKYSLDVRGIQVKSVDYFGSKVGFVKAEAAIYKDNVRIPGIVFLRGDSVAILVVISCNGQKYVLLTCQIRVALACEFLELPAGMMDGLDSFALVAAKELKEECGLDISKDSLIDLGVYVPSAGACDEQVQLFAHETEMTVEQLDILKSHLGGLREHGEHISLRVVEFQQLDSVCNDSKALVAMLRYQKLQ